MPLAVRGGAKTRGARGGGGRLREPAPEARFDLDVDTVPSTSIVRISETVPATPARIAASG